MSIVKRNSKLLAGAFALAALFALPARADWSLLNMPKGVSVLSREIYDMHMIMLWICLAIAQAARGIGKQIAAVAGKFRGVDRRAIHGGLRFESGREAVNGVCPADVRTAARGHPLAHRTN